MRPGTWKCAVFEALDELARRVDDLEAAARPKAEAATPATPAKAPAPRKATPKKAAPK